MSVEAQTDGVVVARSTVTRQDGAPEVEAA
jgi:hypothetical protein